MNALVEPLPFVPAICIGFRSLRSDDYRSSQRCIPQLTAGSRGSHLVSYPAAPFNHLRYCILVHAPARFSDGIQGSKVALQGIEGLDSILRGCISELCCLVSDKAGLLRRSDSSLLEWWRRVLLGREGGTS